MQKLFRIILKNILTILLYSETDYIYINIPLSGKVQSLDSTVNRKEIPFEVCRSVKK